jgi:hypothetical protein
VEGRPGICANIGTGGFSFLRESESEREGDRMRMSRRMKMRNDDLGIGSRMKNIGWRAAREYVQTLERAVFLF